MCVLLFLCVLTLYWESGMEEGNENPERETINNNSSQPTQGSLDSPFEERQKHRQGEVMPQNFCTAKIRLEWQLVAVALGPRKHRALVTVKETGLSYGGQVRAAR